MSYKGKENKPFITSRSLPSKQCILRCTAPSMCIVGTEYLLKKQQNPKDISQEKRMPTSDIINYGTT